MKRINNFVKNTFKDLPKENREQVITEVTELLLEKVADLIESGLTEDDAINRAVTEFGTVDDYEPNPKKITRRLRIEKTIRHYRNDLLFSIFGTTIIIGTLVFVNLYYVPGNLWFVIPSIAVLWWPLAVLYHLLNKKESKRGEKDE